MKKYLFILLLFIGCKQIDLQGSTYYVAPNGNDAAAGTISAPWRTWNYGFNHISAGDQLYIRGGIYNTSGVAGGSEWNGVYVTGKNGSSSSLYSVSNYPGEVPILNCLPFPSNEYWKRGINIVSCSYWYLKGLIVEYVKETGSTDLAAGIEIQSSDYVTLDLCVTRYNGGPGVAVNGFSDWGYVINCDSHDNSDTHTSPPGDFADGFIFSHYGSVGGYHTIVIGCRAWHNSDDGFDNFVSNAGNYGGFVQFTNCWAWDNGYGGGGDGEGFKRGASISLTDGTLQRVINNCVAFYNHGEAGIGFDQSESYYISAIYNNTSFHNQAQGFFNDRNVVSYFRNNIGLSNGGSNWVAENNFTEDHNTWDAGYSVSASDFVDNGLDTIGVSGARQPDGSLPDLPFLHLKAGSALIDHGVSTVAPGTSITYLGSAPELGAYEYNSGASLTVPTVTTGTFTVSGLTNASGTSNITNAGSGSISSKGVCYSITSTSPTTADSYTNDGSGTGSYLTTLMGLTQGVTYYIRAYAINGTGIGYGTVVTITTGITYNPSSVFTKIGSQFGKIGITFGKK